MGYIEIIKSTSVVVVSLFVIVLLLVLKHKIDSAQTNLDTCRSNVQTLQTAIDAAQAINKAQQTQLVLRQQEVEKMKKDSDLRVRKIMNAKIGNTCQEAQDFIIQEALLDRR